MLYGLYWQDLLPWRELGSKTPSDPSAVSGDYIAEVLDLEPGQVLPYCFECLEGGRLDFSVSSSTPIDVFVCTGDQFERWADHDFDYASITAIEIRKGVQSTSISIHIIASNEYAVTLVNDRDHPVPILVLARPIDPPLGKSRSEGKQFGPTLCNNGPLA